jgi:hypothetical protein
LERPLSELTVLELKHLIETHQGLPAQKIELRRHGRVFRDQATLTQCAIVPNATVLCLYDVDEFKSVGSIMDVEGGAGSKVAKRGEGSRTLTQVIDPNDPSAQAEAKDAGPWWTATPGMASGPVQAVKYRPALGVAPATSTPASDAAVTTAATPIPPIPDAVATTVAVSASVTTASPAFLVPTSVSESQPNPVSVAMGDDAATRRQNMLAALERRLSSQ